MSAEKKLADALRSLAQLVHTQNGNRHEDVNQMLASASEALAAHDARALAAEHKEGLMIIGNPVDGFRFVGPFACESDGVEWAIEHASDDTWTTATMQEP